MHLVALIRGTIFGCNALPRILGAACANMAALIGSGLLDRFPRLRLGCLEAGHGWLPFWMARLDEHMETIRSALPPDLKHHPSEYVMSGRYYQSIEMSEAKRSPTWLPISLAKMC